MSDAAQGVRKKPREFTAAEWKAARDEVDARHRRLAEAIRSGQHTPPDESAGDEHAAKAEGSSVGGKPV